MLQYPQLNRVIRQCLILSHHKNLCQGDYLIDDRPHKCGADQFVGEVLHFNSERFPYWASVVEYLMQGKQSLPWCNKKTVNLQCHFLFINTTPDAKCDMLFLPGKNYQATEDNKKEFVSWQDAMAEHINNWINQQKSL